MLGALKLLGSQRYLVMIGAVLVPARDALNLTPDFAFYSWTRAEILQGRQRGQAEIAFPDLNTLGA